MTEQETAVAKVRILRDNREPMSRCVRPNVRVGCEFQTYVADVDASWIHGRKLLDQYRRQILVEQ
jgi:hypothetical protein